MGSERGGGDGGFEVGGGLPVGDGVRVEGWGVGSCRSSLDFTADIYRFHPIKYHPTLLASLFF